MKYGRVIAASLIAIAAIGSGAGEAQAQLFLKAPDFSGPPVTGTEPGMMLAMPGARPEEVRAGLVWSMRAALNVAALQCQFEPTLLTLNQYNYLISNHSAEFASAYSTLNSYFKRTNKNPKAAQVAIDQFGTRTYSGFSTVQGQLGFCTTASRVGRTALFAPRGAIGDVAARRMSELRNSLKPASDLIYSRFTIYPPYRAPYIPLEDRCWDRKNELKKNCRVG